jgi:asparagine synthetase B (glutamine-hydrolysing)
MTHAAFFRVEQTVSVTPFPFRGQYLHPTTVIPDSPVLVFVTDDRGFLVWKSLGNRDNAHQIFDHLLADPSLSIQSFEFATESFAFVFYDTSRQVLAFGKDRLGLSSLVWTETPITLASHDLDGEEHPPGLTVLGPDSRSDFAYPKFERGAVNDSVTVDEAIDHLTAILVRNVCPDHPVMFSGGIDSTLMAACLGLSGAPRVVLINYCASEWAPDRAASRASVAELRTAFPNTEFELREFTGKEVQMATQLPEIRGLLKPLAVTEMNLNIAMTLHSALSKSESFAAHSGLGADELFCGYLRMRSDETTQEEVMEHMNRLWLRNGGRDDRVCLHLGKQCICPYLAPEFIDYALSLPTEMLIKPELPRGQGEKWILRQIARKYGLNSAANRPKQAMQFGSKVAKANWRGPDKIPQSEP